MLLCNTTLFIPINKTGTTSIRNAILESGVSCAYIEQIWEPELGMRHRLNQYHGHYHITRLLPQLGVGLDTLWKYTMVRNPWQRFYSWYAWRLEANKGISFPQFMHRILSRQTDYRTPTTQSSYFARPDLFDYVGKLEEMDQAWKTIQSKIGIKIQIGQSNRSNSDNWKEAYTPELVQRVAEAEDYVINRFNYRW